MKVILATGGSGGHVVPAIRTAEVLVAQGHEVYFVGAFFGNIRSLVESKGFDFYPLAVKGFCWKSTLALIISLFQAFLFLQKYKPNSIIGFGGYGSFPAVFVGALLNYPTLIHEQNVVQGKANGFLAKIVKRIAISFEGSRKYFPEEKVILTGCPCNVKRGEQPFITNNDQKRVLAPFNKLYKNKKTVLVLGGSQGSQRINSVFMETIKELKDEIDFQVIHIAGKNDYDKLKQAYMYFEMPVALFAFLDQIQYAYSLADIIISRAGAVTVTELALAQRPVILIPYPYAGGHQKYNAQELATTHNAQIIEEKDLSTQSLKEALIKGLKTQPSYKMETYFSDAAHRLAAQVLEIVC
ncbi:UDP-N-acetylglucosamine--N-acetylmuramyl-(pentapeptide) pyrophosphoryl-undecaprenol N-acetylglucosamine transferase [hydrothermal vent metagenome]|uniref:UDP-N-acetylglucosamine--N-acetylmuramyl-(Pentapeptide) pyrophosphoryl-undecaprenol N-acetylglucosamine transferase n=1 Tax=hydrothermal vent metagenome TaxID=652676 RepID=A0A3B1DM65_9ZZZZ